MLGLLIVLALGRVRAYAPSQDDLQWGAQWQEAAALAAPELRKGHPVNVELSTSVDVMRYYLRGEPGIDPALLSGNNPEANLIVVSEQARNLMDHAEFIAAATRDGRSKVIARLNRVYVLKR